MIKVSTTGMVVSLKTDLRFPIPGQQGHGGRIIHYIDIQRCEYWFHESDTTHAALIRFASDRLSPVPIADAEFWPFRSFISSHTKNPWKPVYGILRFFKDSGKARVVYRLQIHNDCLSVTCCKMVGSISGQHICGCLLKQDDVQGLSPWVQRTWYEIFRLI